MNSRISFGISVLVTFSALSGCIVSKGGEPASSDATTDGAGGNGTSGPTAVLVITVNGTEVYSSESEDAASPSGTTASGNSTSNGTTAASTTAASGSASPSPTVSGSVSPSASASAGPTASASSSPSATTSSPPGPSGSSSSAAAGGNETSNETDSGVTIEPNVNVTFDASESEGTNLTFSWTVGNFTSENETFEYAFNETGTYNVTLTVTDLLNATDEQTVEITVGSGAAAVAAGTVLVEEEHSFNGGTVQGGTPTCQSAQASMTDKTYTLTINDTVNGTPADVSLMVLEASYGSAGIAARITVQDPAGEQIDQANNDLEIEGPLVPGDYTIIFRLCGPYSTSSTVDVTVTYVAR